MKKTAIFSENRTYRYILEREWDATVPKIMFIGTSPSTGDEFVNSAEEEHYIDFAKKWGHGGIVVTNLFAAFSLNDMFLTDPVGPENDYYIKLKDMEVAQTVCAWGMEAHNAKEFKDRIRQVMAIITDPFCLAFNGRTGPMTFKDIPGSIEPYTVSYWGD